MEMAFTPGDMLKKVVGDVPDEIEEAVYRLAASRLSSSLRARLHKQIKDRDDNGLIDSRIGQLLLSEPVFNFALAAVLVSIPGDFLAEARCRVGYNLRVDAYGNLLDEVLEITGVIQGEMQAALEHARNVVSRPGSRRGKSEHPERSDDIPAS
jgi:hypothetical protein